MEFKLSRKIVLSLIVVAASLLGLGLYVDRYQPKVAIAPAQIVDEKPAINPQIYYADQLAQEEQEVWQAIETEYGISKADFDQKYNEYVDEYYEVIKELETGVAVPADIEMLVTQLCQEGNIDKSLFVLQLVDPKDCKEANHSPATANDKQLSISLDFFNKLDPEAKRHCLLHEMQHIIHKDNSTKAVLFRIMEEKNVTYDPKNADTAYNKLSRFHEKRADRKPALINRDHALDHKIYMEKMFERRGETPGISHPKNSERVAIAQEIYANMNLHTA